MATSLKQTIIVFFLLWLHVTILDLFYVTRHSIVFLWEDNFAPITLLTHFLTALVGALLSFCVCRCRMHFVRNSSQTKSGE